MASVVVPLGLVPAAVRGGGERPAVEARLDSVPVGALVAVVPVRLDARHRGRAAQVDHPPLRIALRACRPPCRSLAVVGPRGRVVAQCAAGRRRQAGRLRRCQTRWPCCPGCARRHRGADEDDRRRAAPNDPYRVTPCFLHVLRAVVHAQPLVVALDHVVRARVLHDAVAVRLVLRGTGDRRRAERIANRTTRIVLRTRVSGSP